MQLKDFITLCYNKKLKEFSENVGIDRITLYKIINGKSPCVLKRKTIQRIIEETAGLVSYNDLMMLHRDFFAEIEKEALKDPRRELYLKYYETNQQMKHYQ